MGSREAANPPFTARGLYIGGVYPFSTGQTISSSLIQEKIKGSSFFCLDFPNREKFVEFRGEMHEPEYSWHDLTQVLFFETKLLSVTLSTGRKLENAPFYAYLSVNPSGFATIIFWIRMSEHAFVSDEIIELVAITRGTHERIKPLEAISVDLKWGDQIINVENMVDVCERIQREFFHEILNKSVENFTIQFLYPIVYVQEVPGCKTARVIIERYPRTITGLSNLWIGISEYLNQEEVRRTIEGDTNPFDVAASFISTCCAIELHPETDEAFLEKTGLTAEQNHFLERTYLAFNCEFPILQFFILRVYDAKLSTMPEYITPSRRLLFNPFYPFRLVLNAIQLTKLQQQLTLDINQFRGIHLLRKSYLQRSFEAHRAAFGTSNVEENIDKKLLALQNQLNTTYSMLTTIFILLLSVLAVIFGLIQTIGALRSLGWLP